MQNIDSDLIRGNIDTIILKTMLNEDKYGLDIIKEVSDRSSGTYELKQPTLYSCLKRLENQELISSYWVDSDIGGKRHYYKLTEKGRDFYNKKQEEWAKSKFIIDNLLSNYNYEEYRLVSKKDYDNALQGKTSDSETAESEIDEDLPTDETTDEQTVTEENEVDETLDENEETETADEVETESDEEVDLDEDHADESPSETTTKRKYYIDDFDDEEPAETEEDEQETLEDENLDTENADEESFENEETSQEDEVETEIDEENSEVFELGQENETDEVDEEDEESIDYGSKNEDNYPTYFNVKKQEDTDETKETSEDESVSYETNDQNENELNLLSKLKQQDDEEINTYYGDKNSYVNHLNSLKDSQIEQQDLLDDSLYKDYNEVDSSIEEFKQSIDQLNNFSSEGTTSAEDEQQPEVEDNEIQDENYDEEIEDDLDELKTLKNNSYGFFKSFDNAEYDEQEKNNSSDYQYSESTNDSEYQDEYNNNYNFTQISEEIEPQSEPETEIQTTNETNNYSEIDSIITNNISSTYNSPIQPIFKPQQSGSYREKLSDLSKYSRVTLEEEPRRQNDEAIEKAKNISEITKELEEEGIKVKEHYKMSNTKKEDRNYLLTNKINLIRSLILFFGYVFVLSAVYIILNNTPIKENSWFSIKYFLLGFIPFAVIFIYYLAKFLIHPYKKVMAKYHARIMFFISFIITIQLLLITYCVNLQMGFYSFSQQAYNHLFWIVPTIISFAPMVDYFIYLALYKSKNFHM